MDTTGTEITWTRTQTKQGTQYAARSGRVLIVKRTWPKPGFKNITSSGWVILIDGKREGAAHPTATKAKAHAAQPGVRERIRAQLDNV